MSETLPQTQMKKSLHKSILHRIWGLLGAPWRWLNAPWCYIPLYKQSCPSRTLSPEAARQYLQSLMIAKISKSMSLTHGQVLDLMYDLFVPKVSIPSDGAEAFQTTTIGCDDIQLGTDDQFHTDQSWSQSHSDMGGAMTEVS